MNFVGVWRVSTDTRQLQAHKFGANRRSCTFRIRDTNSVFRYQNLIGIPNLGTIIPKLGFAGAEGQESNRLHLTYEVSVHPHELHRQFRTKTVAWLCDDDGSLRIEHRTFQFQRR